MQERMDEMKKRIGDLMAKETVPSAPSRYKLGGIFFLTHQQTHSFYM